MSLYALTSIRRADNVLNETEGEFCSLSAATDQVNLENLKPFEIVRVVLPVTGEIVDPLVRVGPVSLART